MELSSDLFLDVLYTSRIFEICSFLIANLIIGAIFFLFLGQTLQIYILYFFAFVFSILLLKNHWLLSLVSKKHNQSIDKEEDNSEPLDFSLWKTLFVVIKQIFYNTSHEIFPILIVWIGTFGLVYVLINSLSTIIFGSNFLILDPKPEFFPILTVLGILLGVYQFHLSRHEQKILTKINMYSHQIQAIIQNETTFEKYLAYISSKYDEKFVSWVDESTNPKLQSLNLLRAIRKEPDIFEAFRSLLFPISRDRSFNYRNRPLVNFQIMYRDSNQKFETIEYLAKIENHELKLSASYYSFFLDDRRTNEIITKMREEIDFDEFGVLTLSNINIVTEIIPDFINLQYKRQINDLFRSQDEQNLIQIPHMNAREFRSRLEMRIMKVFFREIFGN